MSGHSKWSQIKRQKGVNDAKKGQAYTKLGREILVTARNGGPDPETNYRLRLVIQKAREANMPMDNIDRAIKKAVGGGDGTILEEINYQGYGPGGSALIVEVMTDNRNRAAAEIRNAFTRGGGNLGETGCVAWMFQSRGVVGVQLDGTDPDEATLIAIDAGADDVRDEDGELEVLTDPAQLDSVRRQLEANKLKVTSAEQAMIATTGADLKESDALQLLKLIDRLEDLDDVQKVWTNVDFSDEVLEKYAG
jgi:YebC/PmpR family DNA-binding regulatory protein